MGRFVGGGGSVTIRGVVQRESLQGFYLQRLASLFPRVAEHLEHLRGNQAVFVQTECFRGYSLLSPIPVGSALMGYLIRLRVYERVGVSLVEVCEWVGKSVISVVKRLKRADRSGTFYVSCEKNERTFCFCSLFIF